jgi:hypothetical protein
VRPDEVVRAVNQLKLMVETLLPSDQTDRSATQRRRALSNREVQPFNKRPVSFTRFSESHKACFNRLASSDQGSALDLHDRIVPTGGETIAATSALVVSVLFALLSSLFAIISQGYPSGTTGW